MNVVLWLGVPELFWFWWNAIGTVVTLGVALAWSVVDAAEAAVAKTEGPTSADIAISRADWGRVPLLLGFFVLIVLFSLWLPSFFV